MQHNETTIKHQPHLYSFETFRFMFQVIEAVVAVTVVAELAVCKAVTVSKGRHKAPFKNVVCALAGLM